MSHESDQANYRYYSSFSLTCAAPETLIKRQATQHGCLPSLLGDGDKGIEKVYTVRKKYLYSADESSQGRTKISCTGTTSPTNQPRKGPFHLYSLNTHSPQFQQSAGATSLWSLWRRSLYSFYDEIKFLRCYKTKKVKRLKTCLY